MGSGELITKETAPKPMSHYPLAAWGPTGALSYIATVQSQYYIPMGESSKFPKS